MSILNTILIFVGIFIVLVMLCKFSIRCAKWNPWKADYDERQSVSHGKASTVALFIGCVYFIGLSIYFDLSGHTESASLLVLLGAVFQIFFIEIYRIFTHSSLPLFGKTWSRLLSSILSTAISALTFQYEFSSTGKNANELTSWAVILLLITLMMGTTTLMELIAYFRDKRASDEQ